MNTTTNHTGHTSGSLAGARYSRAQTTPRESYSGAFPVSGEVPMPNPTNTLDSMIAASKRELDAAREDGDATRICRAVAIMNGRLDRRLREHSPNSPKVTSP
jgi:hypothetical protein